MRAPQMTWKKSPTGILSRRAAWPSSGPAKEFTITEPETETATETGTETGTDKLAVRSDKKHCKQNEISKERQNMQCESEINKSRRKN